MANGNKYAVATLGNYLYIDGGEVAQYVDGVADGARQSSYYHSNF